MIVLVKLTVFLTANFTFSLFFTGSCATLVIASVSTFATNTVCKLVNFACKRYSTATSICFAMVCIVWKNCADALQSALPDPIGW